MQFGSPCIKSEYLYVSRQATYPASLKCLEEEQFETLFKEYSALSIESFLTNIGIEERDKKKIEIEFTEEYSKIIDNFGSSDLFERLKKSVVFVEIYKKTISKKNELLRQYLKQKGFFDVASVAIVDVGWRGSIQDNIARCVGGEVEIRGYYCGLNNKARISKGNQKEGLIFSEYPYKTKNFAVWSYDSNFMERLLTASHGVPSPLVWEKYIDKYSELQEVKFRDKRFGWHYFSMYIKSKKGTYRKRLDEDFYERLFLDNTTLRPICYDCPVKRSGSGADITLADCWGSDKLCKEIQDTDRGLSLVLIHTKQGKYLWKKLIENQCIRTERLAAEKALSSQSALIESAPCNPRRKVFFESLQKSGFAKLEKSWYGDSVIRRIKRKEIYYKTKLLFMIKVKDKMGKNK